MDRSTLRRDALKYMVAAATLSTVAFVGVVIAAKPPSPAVVTSPAPVTPTDESTRPFVLTVPCWDAPVAAVTQPPPGRRWLRITGQYCGRDHLAPEAITVTNATNHYLATIFAANQGLTTDLIELAPGANDVQITIARAGGREVKHLALTR